MKHPAYGLQAPQPALSACCAAGQDSARSKTAFALQRQGGQQLPRSRHPRCCSVAVFTLLQAGRYLTLLPPHWVPLWLPVFLFAPRLPHQLLAPLSKPAATSPSPPRHPTACLSVCLHGCPPARLSTVRAALLVGRDPPIPPATQLSPTVAVWPCVTNLPHLLLAHG